jgi:Repeat of unknown function (DUF5650)/MBG domain (YGX type)
MMRSYFLLIQSSALIRLVLISLLILTATAIAPPPGAHAAQQTDIFGPGGSGAFGSKVIVLPNGNFIVADPGYDEGAIADVGAVSLYSGATLELISMLKGSTANDKVGNDTILVLTNSNFVVASPSWDNATIADAGAVTWGSGTTGISGVVSAANSLVGSTANDQIGGASYASSMLTALPSGNYLVRSPAWDNSTAVDAGAVTWGSGTSGISGTISAANSLVGSSANDRIGDTGVVVLAQGNYVTQNMYWDNAGIVDAGAVTWGSGVSGVSGVISGANSLVGSSANDTLGEVSALTNGNYLVRSSSWSNGAIVDAGAVTWGSGTTGISGTISATNSLVGSSTNDQVGLQRIVELTNGNYVVSSPSWNNGAIVDAGAVTWGSGTAGVSGAVAAANSLVGSSASDQVGFRGATALTNGNYVVASSSWNNGAIVDAGAVTWGSGTTGVSGAISLSNSLIGARANDFVGGGSPTVGITALTNGHYVVFSSGWGDGVVPSTGAFTWADGTQPTSAVVSPVNSMVGSSFGDLWGEAQVTELTNGTYVVALPQWDNGAASNAGAVIWGSGTGPTSGVISSANALVGSSDDDALNGVIVTPLTNGNYVVSNLSWDNGALVNAGAVTWGSGTTGATGIISASNSLVGTTAYDNIAIRGVTALTNGNYVVSTSNWDNGAIVDAGAVTWGSGMSGVSGPISAANSLVGSSPNDRIGAPTVAPITAVVALPSGNYVVASPGWNNGAHIDAGAVTWANGTSGISGAISSTNSLVGTASSHQVGSFGITVLTSGDYLARSIHWDYGTLIDTGAVTWGSGAAGISGAVSEANSLVGASSFSRVGGFTWLIGNEHYLVGVPQWDNGDIPDAGAGVLARNTGGILGVVSPANSVHGTVANGGSQFTNSDLEPIYHQLFFGMPAENRVVVLTVGQALQITGAAPGAGQYGTAYTHTFAATGWPIPTFSITGGSLPPGLTLSAAGVLSGTPTQAGSFTGITITADNGVDPVGTQTFALTIAPAPLFVTADDQARPLGAANPPLTYEIGGLVMGDTAAGVLTGALATAATPASPAGSYMITQGTLAAHPNYAISFSPGTLTIMPGDPVWWVGLPLVTRPS